MATTAKSRVVKYAGVSIQTAEDGKKSAHFHTSNNVKYAVWVELPEKDDGPGKMSVWSWYKMPSGTDKTKAMNILLANRKLMNSDDGALIKTKLQGDLAKNEPKPKKQRTSKKVTVTVEKKMTDKDAATAKSDSLKKIKDAAAARREQTAG